jgi:hypothetical protein
MSSHTAGAVALLLALAGPLLGVEPHADEPLADEPLVRLVSGETFAARLASIDARWNFTFDAGAQQRVVGAADLVSWGGVADPLRRQTIVLAGGGILAVDRIASIDAQEVAAYSLLFGEIRLPKRVVRGAILSPPSSLWKRDRLLAHLAESSATSDRLLLVDGEELVGVIGDKSNGDKSNGEDSNGESESIAFKLPAGDVSLPLARIAAVAFQPAAAEANDPAAAAAWMGLADGSLLEVAKVTSRIGSVEVVLAAETGLAGPRLTASAGDLWPAITFVLPLTARVTSVEAAALEEPSAFRQIPFLEVSRPWVAHGNILGGRLRSRGAIFPRGIGMPSDSRLALAVPAGARRFQAEAAIDDLAGADDPHGAVESFPTSARGSHASPRGSAIFRVLSQDSAGAWQTAFESAVLRAGDEPAAVDIDLAGAARIVLIVDRADRGQVRDYANWLGARWIR